MGADAEIGESANEIERLEQEILHLKEQLAALRRSRRPQFVEDYELFI